MASVDSDKDTPCAAKALVISDMDQFRAAKAIEVSDKDTDMTLKV
jgi:hypothetical protein